MTARVALRRLGEKGALRALARETAVSSALLSLVAGGERSLTSEVAARLVAALQRLRSRVVPEARALAAEYQRCAEDLRRYAGQPRRPTSKARKRRSRKA